MRSDDQMNRCSMHQCCECSESLRRQHAPASEKVSAANCFLRGRLESNDDVLASMAVRLCFRRLVLPLWFARENMDKQCSCYRMCGCPSPLYSRRPALTEAHSHTPNTHHRLVAAPLATDGCARTYGCFVLSRRGRKARNFLYSRGRSTKLRCAPRLRELRRAALWWWVRCTYWIGTERAQRLDVRTSCEHFASAASPKMYMDAIVTDETMLVAVYVQRKL